MTTNGTATIGTAVALPTIERPDPAADLDALDDQITALADALRATITNRAQVDDTALAMERIEASHVVTVEGSNAEQRKARLTLTLADDAHYEAARQAHRRAREALAGAEHEAQVARERARLLRLAIELRIAVERT